MVDVISRGDREYKKFMVDAKGETSIRVQDQAGSSSKATITGESVAFSAGAAGTTGVVTLLYAPVCNASGATTGSTTDTSFAWVTGTVLTTPVVWRGDLTQVAQLAALAQGEYAINYDTGEIRYCKKTTGTSDTCGYIVRSDVSSLKLDPGDIEIGAVELKDSATDTRANILAANTSRTTATIVVATQHVDETGAVLASADTAANASFAKITDGTTVADVIVQDAAFGTAAKGLPLFGKYQATPTTYTDNDAAPVLLDVNGRVVLSSDIQIGAVELKDGDSDTRADIHSANTAALAAGLTVVPARYMATPPTLTDTFTSPLLLDSTGKLITAAANTEYIDDGTGFTVTSSKGQAIMAIATSDSVDTNDVGALRMTTARNLGVDIASQSLTAVAVSATQAANAVGNPIYSCVSATTSANAVGNPIYAAVSKDTNTNSNTNPIFGAITDATTTATVTTGTIKGLNAVISDGTTAPTVTTGTIKGLNTVISDGTTAPTVTTGTIKGLNTVISDGTTTPTVSTGTIKALNVLLSDGTTANSVGAPIYAAVSATTSANAVGNPIYSCVSATTSANAVGNPIYAAVSATTSANAVGNPIYSCVSATTSANAVGNPIYAAISATTAANSATNPIFVNGQYTAQVALTGTPQTLTGAWADLGAEQSCAGFNKIKLYFDLNINDSLDFRVKALAKHTTAGADEYDLPFETPTGAGRVGIVGAYFECDTDADQKLVLEFPVSGVPFVQFQVMVGTLGASAGIVTTANVVKCYD